MQTHRAVNWTAGALLFTSLLFATQPGWAGGPQMLRGHVPAGAAKLQPTGRLLATQKLDLVIGLPLRNRQELATLLQQISDPARPHCRHHLTPEPCAARLR